MPHNSQPVNIPHTNAAIAMPKISFTLCVSVMVVVLCLFVVMFIYNSLMVLVIMQAHSFFNKSNTQSFLESSAFSHSLYGVLYYTVSNRAKALLGLVEVSTLTYFTH